MLLLLHSETIRITDGYACTTYSRDAIRDKSIESENCITPPDLIFSANSNTFIWFGKFVT